MLHDIRRGATPPRAKDRGLTVNHLKAFFDPGIWRTFEGDSENVLYLFFSLPQHSTCVIYRRISSPSIETFSLDWHTMSPSGLLSPKRTFPVSETTNLRGSTRKVVLKSVCSTQGGFTSPRQKISPGPISGTFQTLRTARREGLCGDGCLSISSD